MQLTSRLLQYSPNTELSVIALEIDNKLSCSDLLKQVAREMFNSTQPVININSDLEFATAIKIAISAKYSKPKDINTIDDLIQSASDFFKLKIHGKLIKAACQMGTHVPKMTSTCIGDSAVFFEQAPQLTSGITSATLNSNCSITGSKDGTFIASYGLLSAVYKDKNGTASIFDRIIAKDPIVLKTLNDLGGESDEQFIDDLVDAARNQHTRRLSKNDEVSQYYKQNFVNYNGKRITVTPLQSVTTTISLKNAINDIYLKKNGRVNCNYYAAGGANTQNVSALNQDIGGAIPHLSAWIPSKHKCKDAFYFMMLTKTLLLSVDQKQLITELAHKIKEIERKEHSCFDERNEIDRLFGLIASFLLRDLISFAGSINKLEQHELIPIKKKINYDIELYFKASSIPEKSEASELLALKLLVLVAAELDEVRLNSHITDRVFSVMTKIFEKGNVLCPLL